MVFLHVNHWCQWFFNGFFYMWIIGVNGFSMVFQISTIGINGFSNGFLQSNHCHCMNGLWLTIDINGLSMVLGKVNAGSQKRPNRKKTWFFQQKHRGKQTLDRLTWPNVTKVSLGNHFSSILALWSPCDFVIATFKSFNTHHCHWMNGWKTTIDINGFTMVFGLQNHW